MSPISHLVDGCAACGRVQNAVELSRDKRLRQRAGLCGGQCFGNTSIDHKPLWPKSIPGDESRDCGNRNCNFYPLFHCRISCAPVKPARCSERSEEHTSELQSLTNLVCRLLLEKKNDKIVRAG